jgi:hypothetical protein
LVGRRGRHGGNTGVEIGYARIDTLLRQLRGWSILREDRYGREDH